MKIAINPNLTIEQQREGEFRVQDSLQWRKTSANLFSWAYGVKQFFLETKGERKT
jgi:hypothetical protein